MKYYKCLRLNRASWHDEKFVWPLRKSIEVKEATRGKPCGVGLHLAKSINDVFQYGGFPALVFEAKPLSPILGEDETKIRVAKARLVKDVTPDYVLAVNKFLATIPKINWFKNHRPPKPEWKMFDTRNSAYNAAYDAARAAASDAARNAAYDAASDAAIFAVMLICQGLKLDKKDHDHIKARWEVWQRGYGLLCDVDEVLCVYRKP
jgi:hypothetical protein